MSDQPDSVEPVPDETAATHDRPAPEGGASNGAGSGGDAAAGAADNGEAGGGAATAPDGAGQAQPAQEHAEGERVPVDAAPVEPGNEPTAAGAGATAVPPHVTAELEALRTALDERTRDLQRISAEYANYRKRVERDRALAGEQAVGSLVTALLPVLDDLDRAREHDELAEGVAAVADQLVATLGKSGLAGFGEKGDPFDPNRHEAVAHQTSPEVTQPTCVDVMRRGYMLGERLLRPAMVAVADPE